MREIPLTFKSGNQQIIGILHLPKVKKAPLLVMVHGWGGNRLGTDNAFFVKAARQFARKDFAVLRFDFRGSGDSEGKFEDQTITSMLRDLDSVISQSSKLPEIDKDKICLIGHSQGGYLSLLKASKDKRIKCLVLWMARTSDLKDFWSRTWLEEIKRRGYIVNYDYRIMQKYEKDSRKYSSLKAIKNLTVPTSLIFGEMDTFCPPSEGLRVFSIMKGPKQLKILPHLDHDFSGENNKREIIQISLIWLKKHLK